MDTDVSWARPAAKYAALYHEVHEHRALLTGRAG
jgi:glycogen synthase